MPSLFLGGLAGGLTGLQQLSQMLIAKRFQDQQVQREQSNADRNYQLAQQGQQFTQQNAQAQLDLQKQTHADALKQQQYQNTVQKYGMENPSMDIDPNRAQNYLKEDLPLNRNFTPGQQTQVQLPGLSIPFQGQQLDVMGYRRPARVEEQAAQQAMNLSKTAGEQSAKTFLHNTDVWTRENAALDSIKNLKPGQVPDPYILTLLNKRAEDYQSEDQKIANAAKQAAAVEQARQSVRPEYTPSFVESTKNSVRRQVTALAAPTLKLAENVANMDAALKGIKEAAGTKSIGPQAQTILVNFQKQLDALSVVREAEYLRSEEIRPFMDKMRGMIAKINTGSGLSTAEFTDYVNMSRQILSNSQHFLDSKLEPFRRDIESITDKKGKQLIPWEHIFSPPWQQPFDYVAVPINAQPAQKPQGTMQFNPYANPGRSR